MLNVTGHPKRANIFCLTNVPFAKRGPNSPFKVACTAAVVEATNYVACVVHFN